MPSLLTSTSRHRPGVTPVTRLNARLKAASDSSPTSAAMLAMLALGLPIDG